MEQNNSKQSNQSEIEFNFIEILRILLNSKRLIILATIAVGAIGSMYSIYFNPPEPPNVESSSVMEIGSYTAPEQMLSQARSGRILIASMDATTARLTAEYAMHRPQNEGDFDYISKFDENIDRIRIYELDSQFLKIEVVGKSFDVVRDKTNEIIEYVKALHDGLIDEGLSNMKRKAQHIEEKLLTIDKYINFIVKDNDVYMSDVAVLKLKEIDYKDELTNINRKLNNAEAFKNTDLVAPTVYKTNYPKSNTTKLVLASFILGLVLSSLLVLLRDALAKHDKE